MLYYNKTKCIFNPNYMATLLNPTTFKDEHWMTSDEAQHYLKVSRSTLYRWCKTKQVPYTKLGGVLYFPKSFIEQFMGRKMVRNTAFDC